MFVGRKYELELIRSHLDDQSKAQLIVLYGRRRIGKSTLIAEAVRNEQGILFFEGIEGARTQKQIKQFLDDLSRQTGRVRLNAKSWPEVFQGLSELLAEGRWVLVFDEFPWMGAGRTQIVSELKLYWDRWARNKRICLFLCGSVASFMTKHVVHSKALHNRKTLELCLGPLSPIESSLFIPDRGLREKAHLYMILGGIPKYLEQINPKISIEQNLNKLFFSANGFFVEEYETLFKEQYRSVRTYESVVNELSLKPGSLSDLSRRVGIAKGGGFLEQITNLVRSQFVREYSPVQINGKSGGKTRLYKLIDPFLLFYFRYVHQNRKVISMNKGKENLFRAIAGPTIDQYYGYAFERLCEATLMTLLKLAGLSLSDVVQMGPYFQQAVRDRRGLQIDWLIIRRDNVWTIFEFKYTSSALDGSVIKEVSRKIERLKVPQNISIESVLVSASGVTESVRKAGFFNRIITLKDLLTLHK